MVLYIGTVCGQRQCVVPSVSRGHSSQGSPHPSPGSRLQQHLALVVLNGLGTEHLPASKRVKQKLSRISDDKNTHSCEENTRHGAAKYSNIPYFKVYEYFLYIHKIIIINDSIL